MTTEAARSLMMELVTIASQTTSDNLEETGALARSAIIDAGGVVGFAALWEMSAVIWGLIENTAQSLCIDPVEYLQKLALYMVEDPA